MAEHARARELLRVHSGERGATANEACAGARGSRGAHGGWVCALVRYHPLCGAAHSDQQADRSKLAAPPQPR